MERIVSELAADPVTFTRHLNLMQDYVRSKPGAHANLMEAANADPEGLTMSITALGAVLLDIAAGAFKITPEEMLDKLAEGVARILVEEPEQPAL